MISVQHEGNISVVGVYGEFELADYQRFEAEVIAQIGRQGRLSLLMDLRDMLGATLDVAVEDIRFTRKHAKDIGRIAILSDRDSVAWTALLSQWIVDTEIQVFDDEAAAREWLATADPGRGFRTLISVADLQALLDDPQLVVFDCRHDLMQPDAGARAYAQSHVPGARFAHSDKDLSGPKTGKTGRHPLPAPETFMAWLGRNGVDSGKQVVAYDHAGGASATRLWWMLRWLGHDRVAVLDGGWEAWTAAGAPVTSRLPAITPTTFTGSAHDNWVGVEYVQSHLGDPDVVVVDARAPERYRGETEPIDPVAGHIPGARNRLYKNNLDAAGHFKPAEVLRSEFTALLAGKRPDQIVHQCGSGVSACHNILAMEIAGLPGSRLYPGSWSEWCADPSRPIEKG